MTGHYICEDCGDEGGSHDEWCRKLRPAKDQWKGNLTRKELEEFRAKKAKSTTK